MVLQMTKIRSKEHAARAEYQISMEENTSPTLKAWPRFAGVGGAVIVASIRNDTVCMTLTAFSGNLMSNFNPINYNAKISGVLA